MFCRLLLIPNVIPMTVYISEIFKDVTHVITICVEGDVEQTRLQSNVVLRLKTDR